jgi:hypothetical protein
MCNIQNVIIKNNLSVCDHSSPCLNSNKLNCSCVCIEKVYFIKYLELYINSQLKWKKKHMDYLIILIRNFLLHFSQFKTYS